VQGSQHDHEIRCQGVVRSENPVGYDRIPVTRKVAFKGRGYSNLLEYDS